MKIISLNVGRPREVEWNGKTTLTSIFKAPVQGRMRVTSVNIQGDEQSDLTVHGGIDKAVYAFASEHYAYWRKELPDLDYPWGAFGENLTTEGLLEDDVHIGDRLRMGSAEFVVTQPRMPCFKLTIRFKRPDMAKRFLRAGRPGYYLAVVKEGDIAAGDAIERIAQDDRRMSVNAIVDLYTTDAPNQGQLRVASELPALPESWREHFRDRLTA